MSPFPTLFSPLDVGDMRVKNRIFLSPMGTHLASERFGVTEALLAYYEARARGGAGYLTTECVLAAPNTRYGTYHNLGLFEDGHIDELAKLTARIHPYGAKIGVQLMHPSSAAAPDYNQGIRPIAPSPIEDRAARTMPRAASQEELEEIVRQFGQAAERAKAAGFDGVEVHCCHGHGLLGKFLSPLMNKRVDGYGGSVEGRLRLPLEVLAQIRARVGPGFPVMVRMSCTEGEPGGQSLMEARYIARRFQEAGASMLHVSYGALTSPWNTTAPSGAARAFNAERAAEIKSCVTIPVGFVGRITEPWAAELALERGQGDAVYLGRALLCDPEFPNKALAGAEETIRPCIGCNHCLSAVNSDRPIQCTMSPEAGHEAESPPPAPARPKRLLVLGGGPAGLAAAAYGAELGHAVTLAERSSRLGGQMYLAAFPPCKQDLALGTRYLIQRCQRAGVEIRLGQDLTPEQIAEAGFDGVILATGGAPVVPGFLAGARELVTAWDALEGSCVPGVNTVIVGGGLVGCETADFLLHPWNDLGPQSRKVTLLEMGDTVGTEERSSFRPLMIRRLLEKGCRIVTGAKVVEVQGDTVRYEKDGRLETLAGVDTVVSAVGVRPVRDLEAGLREAGIPVWVAGDASRPRDIASAVREGYLAAGWVSGRPPAAPFLRVEKGGKETLGGQLGGNCVPL